MTDKIISEIEKLSSLEKHTVISHFFSTNDKIKILYCFYCGKLGVSVKRDLTSQWTDSGFGNRNYREICISCIDKFEKIEKKVEKNEEHVYCDTCGTEIHDDEYGECDCDCYSD
jgi:hypothetical protein